MFGFIFESLKNQREIRQEELERQAWELIDSGNKAAISAFMKKSKTHKYTMQEIYQTHKCYGGDYGKYKNTHDNILDQFEIIRKEKEEEPIRELKEKFKSVSSPEEIRNYNDLLEYLYISVNEDTREKLLSYIRNPFRSKKGGGINKVAKILEKEGYYDLSRVYLEQSAKLKRQSFAEKTTLDKGLVDIVIKMDDEYIGYVLDYIHKERKKGTLTAKKLIKVLKKYGRGDLANMVKEYYNL